MVWKRKFVVATVKYGKVIPNQGLVYDEEEKMVFSRVKGIKHLENLIERKSGKKIVMEYKAYEVVTMIDVMELIEKYSYERKEII